MKIILLGLPAAGKGAQASLLGKHLSVPSVSMGDLLRKIAEEDADIGSTVKAYLQKGDLLPGEIIMPIIEKRLAVNDCRQGFILDGLPRTQDQARDLEHVLTKLDHRLNHVIYLDVDEGVIMRRISGRRVCPKCQMIYHVSDRPPIEEGKCDGCGSKLICRTDDRPETVKYRLRVQKPPLDALIRYYEERKLLRRVDANGEADQVFLHIRSLISGFARFLTIRLAARDSL